MNDAQAKKLLVRMLNRYTPGALLHLIADVLIERAEAVRDDGENRAGRLREAGAALFVVGHGLDAVAGECWAD